MPPKTISPFASRSRDYTYRPQSSFIQRSSPYGPQSGSQPTNPYHSYHQYTSLASLPPSSANRAPLAPLQTLYQPTYTPSVPHNANPFVSGRPQRYSTTSPFEKYAYLREEHNRSPLEYRSPYSPRGGFMNGYQGRGIEQLKQLWIRTKSLSSSKSLLPSLMPWSYGSKPACSLTSPMALPKTLSSTTSLPSYFHAQARVEESSTRDNDHQAKHHVQNMETSSSTSIVVKMIDSLKKANLSEKSVESPDSKAREKEAHAKISKKRGGVQEAVFGGPKSLALAKATGHTDKLERESPHCSGENRDKGETEISDHDCQTPRYAQSLVSEESWIDSGYGSLFGDKESLRGGSPLPVSPVPINMEAEGGDREQILPAKDKSLLPGDGKPYLIANGIENLQRVAIDDQRYKRLQKKRTLDMKEEDPDCRFLPTQCLLESCKEGYVFKTFQSFRSHWKNFHSGKRYCTIPGCPHTGSFASKSDLNRHIMAKHSPTWNAAKHFKCERLSCVVRVRAWMRKDKLLEHNRKYHMNILCQLCYYYFDDFEELVHHTNVDHGWVGPAHEEVTLPDQVQVQLATTQNPVFGLMMNSGETISKLIPATLSMSQSVTPRFFTSCEITSMAYEQTDSTESIRAVADARAYRTCSDSLPKHHSESEAKSWQATGTPPVECSFRRKKIWPEPVALTNVPCQLEFCKDAPNLEGTILQFKSGQEPCEKESALEGGGMIGTMDEGTEGESIESGASDSEGCLYDVLRSNMGRLARHGHHTGEDGVPSTILEPTRLIIIERIMGRFWNVYNKHFSPNITRYAGTGTSPSSASDTQRESQPTNDSAKASAQSKKRLINDDEDCDDRQDGNDDRSRRLTKKPKPNTEPLPKWACPFRKYNPMKYNFNDYYICALRPWETIARVKEHLYRQHMAPPHCRRCWQVFTSVEQLNGHTDVLKADVCELAKGEPPDGVSEHHERALRPKSKRYPNQSDESRWNDIYRILFPNKPVPPTPHFEAPREQLLAEQRSASPNTQMLNDYDRFIREEVPRLFLSEVEEQITPSAFHNFDLESVFRTCLERAASSFRERTYQNQRLEIPRTTETMQRVGGSSEVNPTISGEVRDAGSLNLTS